MTRLIKYLFIAIICLFSYLFPQNGKLNGLQIEWDEDEDKKSEGTYKDGKGVDEREWGYYRNGQMRYEGTYKDGNYDGLWTMMELIKLKYINKSMVFLNHYLQNSFTLSSTSSPTFMGFFVCGMMCRFGND